MHEVSVRPDNIIVGEHSEPCPDTFKGKYHLTALIKPIHPDCQDILNRVQLAIFADSFNVAVQCHDKDLVRIGIENGAETFEKLVAGSSYGWDDDSHIFWTIEWTWIDGDSFDKALRHRVYNKTSVSKEPNMSCKVNMFAKHHISN